MKEKRQHQSTERQDPAMTVMKAATNKQNNWFLVGPSVGLCDNKVL